MQFQSKQVIDDEFFGSNYKAETTTSLTARKLAVILPLPRTT